MNDKINEFPICRCEELKKEIAWNALGYILAFNALCKNEEAAIEPNCAEYTTCQIWDDKKEEHTMHDSITVSCRGFTGELKILAKTEAGKGYHLSIRDTENAVTHVLENVKPNEIKIVSGRVTMGG